MRVDAQKHVAITACRLHQTLNNIFFAAIADNCKVSVALHRCTMSLLPHRTNRPIHMHTIHPPTIISRNRTQMFARLRCDHATKRQFSNININGLWNCTTGNDLAYGQLPVRHFLLPINTANSFRHLYVCLVVGLWYHLSIVKPRTRSILIRNL